MMTFGELTGIEQRDDRKEYAAQLRQERDGHRLQAVLRGAAEGASGSARDVEARRVACVKGPQATNESGTARHRLSCPLGMGGFLFAIEN